MGRFFNPDNTAFQKAVQSQIYIDKTGLLSYTNKVLDTKQAFICNSRPRRFGKSTAADMLSAYYSKGSDSKQLFSNFSISADSSFQQHLNQYDVIHFDVQWFVDSDKDMNQIVDKIQESILKELRAAYPSILPVDETQLPDALSIINEKTNTKFIVIIDEWDVFIRDEAQNKSLQKEYITFLRRMFKGTEPSKFIALAYLTGILPIKKYKTQSALNNFDEFTMLDAGPFAPFIGFTEEEVRQLSSVYHQDFFEVKRWYDGYLLEDNQIYNPTAVVNLMQRGSFKSYWSNTGTYESVIPLINMDFDGLKTAIIEMLSGSSVEIDVNSFQNDTVSFTDRDDVLTYLIHLGYLGYNSQKRCAFIPNEELRLEFLNALKKTKWNALFEFEKHSEQILDATLDFDAETVARQLEFIHTEYASSIQYHDENSLSSVLTIAYLSSLQYYFKPIRELPAGKGFADFIYLPKPEYRYDYPALLVELKWNKNAATALQQIKERNYPQAITDYTGTILLIGITYDKKTKLHQCIIEQFEK